MKLGIRAGTLGDRFMVADELRWPAASYGILAVCLALFSVNAILGYLFTISLLLLILVRFGSFNGRIFWIIFVASLFMSGIELRIGGLVLLPEHIALTILIYASWRHRGSFSRSSSAAGIVFLVALWWIVLFLISVMVSLNPGQSVRLLLWILINIVAAVSVFLLKLEIRIMISDAIRVSVVGCVVSLVGWAVANTTGSLNQFVEKDYASNSSRLQGLMQEPNLFACYLTLLACILYVYRKDIPGKIVVTYFVVAGVTVTLTYTRVAWVFFGLALILMILRQVNFFGKILFVLGVSLATLLLPYILFSLSASSESVGTAITSRVGNIFDFSSGTGALRILTTDQAIDEMTRSGSWITGLGFNAYPQRHDAGVTSYAANYLGNLWIALPYDGGVISTVAFALAVGVLWVGTLRYGSTIFILSFIAFSSTTNPIWFSFVWAFAALILRSRNAFTRDTRSILSRKVPMDYGSHFDYRRV